MVAYIVKNGRKVHIVEDLISEPLRTVMHDKTSIVIRINNCQVKPEEVSRHFVEWPLRVDPPTFSANKNMRRH